MPEPALALLGFMDQPLAFAYLRQLCHTEDASDEALGKELAAAKARLAPPHERVGTPEILDLPASVAPLLEAAQRNPRFGLVLQEAPWAAASFKLVEIAPLLAFQFHVQTERSATLCSDVETGTPTIEQMTEVCLPERLEAIPRTISPVPNGLVIKSKSHNLRLLPNTGDLGRDNDESQQMAYAGIAFGTSFPMVTVARFEGRCYLRNGFHRVYGLQKRGATHVPCVFLEATDYAQIGANGPGFFSRELLESANPPTCGQLTEKHAHPVLLKTTTKIIYVSWSEYSLSED